ncbi:hypothetical protein M432DRAFT_590579 [Thermoascus aurantiacus ATCC 26904]
MHLTTAALALLSSAALVSANPIHLRPRGPESWHVSGFQTGCSPGGCVYSFSIAGPATQSAPAFNTTCRGTDVAGDYQSCADPAVSANLIPRTYPVWGVQVKHEWTRGSGHYTALGNANITQGTTSFSVPVTQEYGVAVEQ